MFKTPEELKAFILWAKDQKIQRVKVDKIEVEMSAYAFIDVLTQEVVSSQVPEPLSEATKTPQEKEEEELLYWSALP